MKNAEEWAQWISSQGFTHEQPLQYAIRQIQADALRWASENISGHLLSDMQRLIDKAHELAPNETQTG